MNISDLDNVDSVIDMYFSPTTGELSVKAGSINEVITQAEAIEIESEFSTDCNIAFQRLATQFDFDVDECLKWYDEQD